MMTCVEINVFFFPILLCSPKSVDHPWEDLARLRYKLNME
jgi:hypothetical protein